MKLRDTCSLGKKSSNKPKRWKWKPLNHVWPFVTPWSGDLQTPLFMEFSRQDYWSGLPFDSPEDLLNPGIETRSPALQADTLSSEPTRKLNDKPREHIKKQRHHIADKGPYIHSYGFPSSHVQMSVLDGKKGWAPNNWYFRSEVLEKTLESHLDSKDTEPVNSKGNQPWILIRRTDTEAAAPILWSLGVKSWLIGKDLNAGKVQGREEKRDDRGWDGWMVTQTQWTWVWENSRRWWWTEKPAVLQSMGVQRVGYDLATEQQN